MRHIKTIMNEFQIKFAKADTVEEQESLKKRMAREIEDLGRFLWNQTKIDLIEMPKGFWIKKCPKCSQPLKNTNKYRFNKETFSVKYCPECDYQTYKYPIYNLEG